MIKRILKIACTLLALLFSVAVSAQNKTISASQSESALVGAVEMYNRGDIPEAEKIFRSLVTVTPDNDAAYYYLGLCRLLQNDVEEAELYLAKAVEMDSKNWWYSQRLAVLYNLTGRKTEALAMYEKLLVEFPKKTELYYDIVSLYIDLKQYDAALRALDALEEVSGENESTVMTRFDLLRTQGKHPEAFECLKEYNSRFSSPQVLSVLGDYEMNQYNDSTAIACYNEALEIDPEYAPALLGRAEAYRMSRRYDEFFPEITRFMSMEGIPSTGKSHYLNAILRQTDPKFQRGFRPQLDKVYEAAAQTHPSDTSILVVTGLYYTVSDRVNLADSCFRRTLDICPDDIRSAVNYCSFLAYTEDWKSLADNAEKFAEKHPGEIAFLDYLCGAAYQMGDYEKVISASQRIVDSTDDQKVKLNYMSNIGDMYHALGDESKSFKIYEKCLKIDPDFAPVLNNYAYHLCVNGKKLSKAYAMSRKTIEAEPDNATYLDTYGWILYRQKKYPEAKGIFKHAMLYGGKESATILDHYAEVLFALKEYDLAMIYWKQAVQKADDAHALKLKQKIEARKSQMKK